jgi:hypothetical protein
MSNRIIIEYLYIIVLTLTQVIGVNNVRDKTEGVARQLSEDENGNICNVLHDIISIVNKIVNKLFYSWIESTTLRKNSRQREFISSDEDSGMNNSIIMCYM